MIVLHAFSLRAKSTPSVICLNSKKLFVCRDLGEQQYFQLSRAKFGFFACRWAWWCKYLCHVIHVCTPSPSREGWNPGHADYRVVCRDLLLSAIRSIPLHCRRAFCQNAKHVQIRTMTTFFLAVCRPCQEPCLSAKAPEISYHTLRQ